MPTAAVATRIPERRSAAWLGLALALAPTVDWVKGTSGYPGIATQFFIQLKAVCLVLVWTAVVAFAAFYVVKLVVGLRVPEDEEREGLDITSHGERAYDL